jgi:hypothetical protein
MNTQEQFDALINQMKKQSIASDKTTQEIRKLSAVHRGDYYYQGLLLNAIARVATVADERDTARQKKLQALLIADLTVARKRDKELDSVKP